jgi:hypothetical protein
MISICLGRRIQPIRDIKMGFIARHIHHKPEHDPDPLLAPPCQVILLLK